MSIKNGALLAVAAGALVLSGCSMFTSHDTDATPAAATPAVKTAGASHACKGMNACKGKHACKGKNACKGMNACKGKHACKGKNACKSKKNCKC